MAKAFIVIEDKLVEQGKALEAIKRVLVAEGDEELSFLPGSEHGLDIRSFVGAKVTVLFAADLETAKRRIGLTKVLAKVHQVCVLTDLMFPVRTGGKEEPNGLTVLADCIDRGVPVVVCSDTNHHDVSYLKEIFPILGKAHPKGEIPVILDNKDWDKAVSEVLRLTAEPE